MNGLNILTGTNGLGKSSLIDILLFTIYNEFSRGTGAEALNIKYNNGYSILRLELNGKKYTIERSIFKKSSKVGLYDGFLSRDEIYDIKILKNKNVDNLNVDNLNLNLNVDNKNLNGDGKVEIDTTIINLFGTYNEMIMTSIILQVGQNFIDLKDKEKKIN